jgi:hypothetical protein
MKYKQIKSYAVIGIYMYSDLEHGITLKFDIHNVTSVLSLAEQLFAHSGSKQIHVPHVVDCSESTAFIFVCISEKTGFFIIPRHP